MSLTRLLIKDFRNIENADLALSPALISGWRQRQRQNQRAGSYLYAWPRSGVSQLQPGRVIRHEQEAFVLHGRLQGEERETSIGLTKDKQGDSKVRIDGTDGHKIAELAHLMPMQLITPEGLLYSTAAPNTEERSLTGDAFTTKPDSSPHGVT